MPPTPGFPLCPSRWVGWGTGRGRETFGRPEEIQLSWEDAGGAGGGHLELGGILARGFAQMVEGRVQGSSWRLRLIRLGCSWEVCVFGEGG